MLRCHRRGHQVTALCVTAGLGLLLAPVSWLPCWVWIVPALIALLSRLQASWQWARAAAVIAVFACTYSVPISQQHHRTLSPFWFFVLTNPYVLTAIAAGAYLSIAVRYWPRAARPASTGGNIR
jgi:multisubunit Na+/H+ antiporter MnhG subunit